jgi:pyruvate dehydrogenase E2 component (dihydrolipoamide acetyltransferase)
MPALELAQETGRVLRWLKAEGDAVAKGEPLMEIETDKVTVDVESPADGVLAGVGAAEGDEVPVGTTVAFLLAPGEALPEASSIQVPPTSPAPPAPEPPPRLGRGAGEGPHGSRSPASPKARRLAAERGIDLDTIAGSGPGGAIVADDLDAAAGPALGPIWRRMAERTTQSWQSTPHFFLVREIDASALLTARESAHAEAGEDAPTITDLLVQIAAGALGRHPRVNAVWRDGAVVPADGVNVGIAVAVDDGLVVPVVHGAERLSLAEIAARRAQLVAAAREGRLRPEDVTGGTFTISNLGMYGVDAFLAIVNGTQAAILAVGRIADRVVAVDGEPAVRPAMTVTGSFDHRVVDGARAAEFLDTLATFAERPAEVVG